MRHTAALIGLVTLLLGTHAYAYSIAQTDYGFTMRWKTLPIAFYVNPVGSDNVNDGTDLQAILDSFSDWQGVACSKLEFDYKGDTDVTSVTGFDNTEPNQKNEITFIEDKSWNLGQYVLAVTIPVGMTDGSLHEADIAFNGYQVKWSTTGKWGRADVKSVALHEIGHAFGLQHVLQGYNANSPPTMAPQADPNGLGATLEYDDKLGACYLYPSESKFTCKNDSQCPGIVDKNPQTGIESYSGKLQCSNGTCVAPFNPPTKYKSLGDPCLAADECKEEYFCQPIGTKAYCASNCVPDSQDCPVGYSCLPYSDGKSGACLPNEAVGGGVNGATCNDDTDCKSNTCYPNPSEGWFCRPPCDPSGPDTCGANWSCFYVVGFKSGGCLPDELVAAFKLQNGYPCNDDIDCASDICIKGSGALPMLCRAACFGPDDACDGEDVCTEVAGVGYACMPPEEPPPPAPGQLGDACNSHNECSTGACLHESCVEACELDQSCGTGDPPAQPDPPTQPDPRDDPVNTSTGDAQASSGCALTNGHSRSQYWIIFGFLIFMGLLGRRQLTC